MAYNNYHTHTLFCDGDNTAEEMVLAAIKAGCGELGFSGHSYLDFDDSWTMTPEKAEAYRRTVTELKSKYASQISLRLGIEQDYCSDTAELALYDYVIGAVHCVLKDGNYISVDASAELLKDGIDKYYGGDEMAFAEDYFALVGDVYNKTKCDIIAHFDLLTKFGTINTENPRYIAAEQKALEKLMDTPAIFEINTGAISRGYTDKPYPGERVLRKLADAGKEVILSSDSHSRDTILFGFDEAQKLCEKYNLKIRTIL